MDKKTNEQQIAHKVDIRAAVKVDITNSLHKARWIKL